MASGVVIAATANADVSPGTPARPGAASLTTPAQPAPTEAADEATAMVLADKFRKPVEILASRTESSQTFAQPDGTLRTTQSATPQRVRRGGSWVPVDTTLRIADGAVVPVASTLDTRFSAGGAGPMLTIAGKGRSLALSWPRPLPVPSLQGDTATYAEVLPGVDLQLAAGPDSFSEVLVVKNADAAKSDELQKLRFGLETSGVTLKQDADTGFIRAVDVAGAPVFVSDGAHMWDSPAPAAAPGKAPSKAGAVAGAAAPGVNAIDPTPQRSEDVAVKLSAQSLTVVPSAEMLTAPQTRFPVYIDPGFNGGKEIWTPVNRKNPTKSYWTDKNWRDSMRVGQSWQSSSDDDWRTLVQFDVRPLKSTKIITAKVIVNVQHTANCTASPFQLWQTLAISKDKAVTWNNTKDRWWKQLAEVKATANKQSCPKGNDQVSFGQKAVTDAFQAATKSDSITFAFRAKSEADNYQWKKLKSDSTFLDINYNRAPGGPAGFSFKPCFQACTGALSTSSKNPTLTMQVADPDGGKLLYQYEVYDSTQKVVKANSNSTVSGVLSNASRGWTVQPALADGQYFWRGRACDTYLCGSYSAWIGFKVDSSNPNAPVVDSDVYKPTGWNGAPGKPSRFTFRPGAASDGVSLYNYTLNSGPAVKVTAGADGVGWTDITPVKDMDNVLRVEAMDKAGNRSGGIDYFFRVKPIGDVWYWGLDESAGTTAPSAPENNRPASIFGAGVDWTPAGQSETTGSATFNGQGELATNVPVLNTTAAAGFTVAAWVRLPAPEPTEDDGTDNPGGDGQNPDEPGDDPDADQPDGDDSPGDDSPGDGGEDGESPTVLPPAASQTAVSEDGTAASMFRLGYRHDIDVNADNTADPAWCMTVKTEDKAAAPELTACTTTYVTPGQWVHLVGIVNPVDNQISLYVNGIPARVGVKVTTVGKANWEAVGKFAIGRGMTAAAPSERWVGGIDEVYALPRIWTDEEIEHHAFSSTADD